MTGRVMLAGALLLAWGTAADAAPKKLLGEGEGVFRPVEIGQVTSMEITQPLGTEPRAALGLPADGPFRIDRIGAQVLLLEFFNASCYACAMQAPVMDEAWRRVQAKATLREKVRFLGIGVGNAQKDVEKFREKYDIPFPLLADPDFAVYDALGNAAGTPFIVVWPKDSPTGDRTPRGTVGLVPDAGRIVAEIEAALGGVPLPADLKPLEAAGGAWRNLPLPIGEEELKARLRAAAAAAGLPDAVPAPVKVGEETYWRLDGGARGVLWAKASGRAKVCNVCHDIFFFVLFDAAGKVVRFEPIHITKYKNVELDEKDVAFLRSRVEGRMLGQEIAFDADVDAVTAATMSTALVFDTLRRLRGGWEAAVKAGTATAK